MTIAAIEKTLFLVMFTQWELRANRIDSALETVQKAIAINFHQERLLGVHAVAAWTATHPESAH